MKKTLFVGIGGFGGKVLSLIREFVQERSHTPENYMFLALDRDADDLRSLEEQGILCACMCRDDYYGSLIARHPKEETISQWFPQAPDFVDSKRHKRNQRVCSRLDFMTTADGDFSKYLEYLLYLHLQKAEINEDLRVVIVASLAGSTGSGMCIPAALHIKKTALHLFGVNAQLCGFFGGPMLFAPRGEPQLKGGAFIRRGGVNTVATLREMDYLTQVRKGRITPPQELWLDGLMDVPEENNPDPIFHHVYYYDRADTMEGEQMDVVDHIARMARLAHTRYDSLMTEQMDQQMGKNRLVQQGETACFVLDEDTSKARDTFRFAQEDSYRLNELPLLNNSPFLADYADACRQAVHALQQDSGPHMDKRLLQWLDSKPQPQPGPTPGKLQTIFIGMGALSNALLYELKNRLGEETITEQYHYVAVDTDAHDIKCMGEQTGIEVMDLSVQLPPKEYPQTDRVRRNFENWFPQEPRLTHTLDYIKGSRIFGRLAFAWAMQDDRLKALEQKLYATYAPGSEELPNVVVITSLMGNTGSGMLIHMALWLKQIFRYRYGKELKVNGFFIGPDVMIRGYELENELHLRTQMESKALAALTELDWLTRLKLGEGEPAEPMPLEGLFHCSGADDRQRIYDYVTYYDADPEQPVELFDQLQQMAKCIVFRHASRERVVIESLLHGDLRWNFEGSLMVPVLGSRAMTGNYRNMGPGVALQDCPLARKEAAVAAYRNHCKKAEAEGNAGPHIDRRWVRWLGITE